MAIKSDKSEFASLLRENPYQRLDKQFYEFDWISLRQVARELGIRKRAVKKRIVKGSFPVRHQGGECLVRIRRSKWAYLAIPNSTANEPSE